MSGKRRGVRRQRISRFARNVARNACGYVCTPFGSFPKGHRPAGTVSDADFKQLLIHVFEHGVPLSEWDRGAR